MKSILFFIVSLFLIFCGCKENSLPAEVARWDIFELDLEGPDSGNPFLDIEFSATFDNKDTSFHVQGFYDGNGRYKIRFSPPEIGTWNYETQSNVSKLSGQTGQISCTESLSDNHGPLSIVNTHYLEYADGTPFFGVGTTAYQWTSVKQSIQEKTIETLSKAPFNKIRMCVFPKYYRYGNEIEPWTYPFERTNGENNLDRPNYAFFQNFDKRIRQLLEMGIQADVILFHPYDEHWGYYLMGDEMNERYVRYMIARISAYRNVWWSLANEWDVPAIKEEVDWDGIGNLLMNEDPHQRFRGIHNWYNSEDHFYDHNKPWVTHASVQTSQFYNIERWRDMYNKPILFDEMRYEGDVPSGWGNLTGQEMSRYFWQAAMCGAYPTHGETIQNPSDTLTEVRWWAKGGELVGESPARIAYFRSIMEQIPFKEMNPNLTRNPQDPNKITLYQLTHRDGQLDMAYSTKSDVEMKVTVSGAGQKYFYLIDTWNMEVQLQEETTEYEIELNAPTDYTLVILSANKLDLSYLAKTSD